MIGQFVTTNLRPYPDAEELLGFAETEHANPEACEFIMRFFVAKNRHDVAATMGFVAEDLTVYADVTLGWELEGYDALRATWAQYMPHWGVGRSYPSRILGELVQGYGSLMLVFTDTPELFGGEIRAAGAVDVRGGKITRWADYWDSANFASGVYDGLKRPDPNVALSLRSEPAPASEIIRRAAEGFVNGLSIGDAAAVGRLFSYDGVLEDHALNTRVYGRQAIVRYLARVSASSPVGAGVRLGRVVGGDLGGGFEWAGQPGSAVQSGATVLALNGRQEIVRATAVYDGRNLSAQDRQALASLGVDPYT